MKIRADIDNVNFDIEVDDCTAVTFIVPDHHSWERGSYAIEKWEDDDSLDSRHDETDESRVAEMDRILGKTSAGEDYNLHIFRIEDIIYLTIRHPGPATTPTTASFHRDQAEDICRLIKSVAGIA